MLLCLGVATYSVALAFLAAAAISVLLGSDRLRRAWIVVLPAVLYLAWWLWARHTPDSSEHQFAASNLLLIPTWSFQSLSSGLGALIGVDYDFAGDTAVSPTGSVIALVAIVALAWRLGKGNVPATLWPALGLLLSLWSLTAVAPSVDRLPWSPLYLYPVAIAVLMVGAEAVRGLRWTPSALVALYAVCAVGVATNLKLLDGQANFLRNAYSPSFRAELTALELAGSSADLNYVPSSEAARATQMDTVFSAIARRGDPPTATYLKAARSLGPLGYSAAELSGQSEATRALTDAAMVASTGIRLDPVDPSAQAGSCRLVGSNPAGGAAAAGAGATLALPPGGAILRAGAAGGPVEIRRFGNAWIPVGTLEPGAPAELGLPRDAARQGWRLLTTARPLRVCVLR